MGTVTKIANSSVAGVKFIPEHFGGVLTPTHWHLFSELPLGPAPYSVKNWSHGGPSASNREQGVSPVSIVATTRGNAIDLTPYLSRRVYIEDHYGRNAGPGTLAIVFRNVRTGDKTYRLGYNTGLLLLISASRGMRVQNYGSGAGLDMKLGSPIPNGETAIAVVSHDGAGNVVAGLWSDGSPAIVSGTVDLTGTDPTFLAPVYLGARETPGGVAGNGPQIMECAFEAGRMLSETEVSTLLGAMRTHYALA